MSIKLVVFLNPLSTDRTVQEHAHGASFRELIDSLEAGRNALVFCNDAPVPVEAWDDIPPDESFILVRIVPGEAVGTFLGKVGATLVLAPIAFIAALATGDWEGSFKWWNEVWGAPTQGDTSTTTLPGLKGASNSIDRWGAVPVILGRHYIAPKYAAQPYTEIGGADGVDQYVHLALLVGYGPLSVSTIRIGENLLASNVADVRTGAITVDGLFQAADVQIEIRQDGAPMTHYPLRVTEDQFEIQLKAPGGTSTYLYRTSAPGAVKLAVDFEFPNGLIYFDSAGKAANASVRLKADYRPAGSAGAWTNFYDTTLTKQLKTTGRYSGSVTVSAGQYEVRAYRVTADSSDSGMRDVAKWTALRSSLADEPVDPDVSAKAVRISMKIKAGDVVNGTLSSINLIAQGLIPVYSGSGSGAAQWATVAATANPAAEALYLLRGAASPKPVADVLIDWPAFEELYTWAETLVPAYPSGTEKRNPCNALLDTQVTLREALSKILAAGRATLTMRGAVYSLVHDVAKSTPVALITPRNSWDFQGAKAFAAIPHGYRTTFINAAAGYQSDECITLADGFIYDIYNDGVLRDAFGTAHTTADIFSGTTHYKLATELESIDRWGLTSYAEAWREARYALAKLYLRPELFAVRQDVEMIGYSRGDRVKFAHDVPLLGVIGGRFKAVTLNGSLAALDFLADEFLTMETGKTYGIRYQRAIDGAVLFALVNTIVGTSKSATFSTAIPAGQVPAPDDLFWFGESGLETIDAIVVGIEPADDLSATIYLQDYAPGVFSADSGTIPAYSSHVSLPIAQDLSTAGEDKADVTVAISQAAGALAAASKPNIYLSAVSASRSRAGAMLPPSIIVTASRPDGTPFAGFILIEVSADGAAYMQAYLSSAAEASHAFTIPATINISGTDYFVVAVQARLYQDATLATCYGTALLGVTADASTAPLYWGPLTAAPSSGMLTNDYYFDSNTSALGGGVLRYWSGSAWVVGTGAWAFYASAVKASMADAVAWTTANSGTIGDVSAFLNAIMGNVIVRTAIIDYLATSTQVSTALCDDGATRIMEILWDTATQWMRSQDQSEYIKLVASNFEATLRSKEGANVLDHNGQSLAWRKASDLSELARIRYNPVTKRIEASSFAVPVTFSGTWTRTTQVSRGDSLFPSTVRSLNGMVKAFRQLSDGRAYMVANNTAGDQHVWIYGSNGLWTDYVAVNIANLVSVQRMELCELADGRIAVLYLNSSDSYIHLIILNTDGTFTNDTQVAGTNNSLLQGSCRLSTGDNLVIFKNAGTNVYWEVVIDAGGKASTPASTGISSAASISAVCPGAVAGTAAFVYLATTTLYIHSALRSASGVWGSASALVSFAHTNQLAIELEPDGTITLIGVRTGGYIYKYILNGTTLALSTTTLEWNGVSFPCYLTSQYGCIYRSPTGKITYVFYYGTDTSPYNLYTSYDGSAYGQIPIKTEMTDLGWFVGQNSNGIYIKGPEGTMICLGFENPETSTSYALGLYMYAAALQTFTFPAAFAAPPRAMPLVRSTFGTLWGAGQSSSGGTTNTTFSCQMVSPSASYTGLLSYIAIGRWK